MRVKICGITRLEDALLAVNLGADFVGLIRAESPRRVSLDNARQITDALPEQTRAVLVVRDVPLDDVSSELEATGCDYVQLHGREPAAYVCELAQRFAHISIIRAWEVSGASAATELSAYLREAADGGVRFEAVILDAPKGGPHPGYECLGEVSRHCHTLAGEFWCAGRLTPENVESAVRAGRYTGVDVASGVEQQPGVKDPDALRRFIATARSL